MPLSEGDPCHMPLFGLRARSWTKAHQVILPVWPRLSAVMKVTWCILFQSQTTDIQAAKWTASMLETSERRHWHVVGLAPHPTSDADFQNVKANFPSAGGNKKQSIPDTWVIALQQIICQLTSSPWMREWSNTFAFIIRLITVACAKQKPSLSEPVIPKDKFKATTSQVVISNHLGCKAQTVH